jgi:hypothetical protein
MVHDNRLLLEDCLDDTPQVKNYGLLGYIKI